MDPSKQTLFLWRNGPCVVIGKHQNPWKECHLQQMEADNVTLARRQSGGGAVYQDLGNSCFTFLSSKDEFDIERNLQIIIRALKNSFNVEAERSGRNDITLNDKKISGSAFKKSLDRSFHHGTVLLDVNTDNMTRYLNPNKAKLQSKGIQSVKSRVLNLKELIPDLTHDALCQAIVTEFCNTYGSTAPVEDLDHKTLQAIPHLNTFYNQNQDWDWRFGQTPAFEHMMETRFDWGTLDVRIQSRNGLITEIVIFSDSLFPQMIEELMKQLKGVSYDQNGIESGCQKAMIQFIGSGCEPHIEQFCSWLCASL